MKTLLLCKEQYEKILSREIESCGFKTEAQGKGWVMALQAGAIMCQPVGGFCFASDILWHPVEIKAGSVNAFIDALLELFLKHIGSSRIETSWGFAFLASGEEKLVRHAGTIQKGWLEKMRKKMSRVARLAQQGLPREEAITDGFYVYITEFNRAWVCFKARSLGQQRMKMDPQAPSRSYLKLEEAWHLMGQAPRDGETVVDLGAAPGGWSYSALKRGAQVNAVDNGPMRDPVALHPHLRHLKEDAFSYRAANVATVDWLLCDVLEKPELVISLLSQWLARGGCRFFVVNLKLGFRDPLQVLSALRDPSSGLARLCTTFRACQLYHDREEITLMGEVTSKVIS